MSLQETKERVERSIASNRRARHDFHILYTLEAGIVLQGTEVKSLRTGKCSLQDSYAQFESHDSFELFLYNLHINIYEQGSYMNHDPKRVRKLLVNQREARKLKAQISEKGLTIVPLSLYFSGHLVKVELAVVKAKKQYDKREATKKRETERDMRRKFGV